MSLFFKGTIYCLYREVHKLLVCGLVNFHKVNTSRSKNPNMLSS